MDGRRLPSAAIRWPARRFGDAAVFAFDTVLGSSAAERAVDRALASDLARHAVDRAFEDALVDRIVQRLLDSDELWRFVEEVARSAAVTEALTQQSISFADQVAGDVRDRSHNADDWLERAARRMLRRPPP